MYTLKIRTKFEAAHRLMSAYSEQCQKIHGHSYKVDWYFAGLELNADGVLCDFKKLKDWARVSTDTWDHTCILQDNDPLVYNDVDRGLYIAAVPFAPTAENLAYYLYSRYDMDPVDMNVSLKAVRVWETEDCYAEYRAR